MSEFEKYLSIAAASVLAKTTRDSLLIDYETDYPGYGFARHKGYGTALHRAARQNDPPCQLARLDGHGDVDQSDFAVFQRCISGPDIPADPNCAD
mgnify:CR=1 FL=1